MNACHECGPTHNRAVREQGRCWCPCHSPVPADSRRVLNSEFEYGRCRGCGQEDALLHADGQCIFCTGTAYVRATIVVNVNDEDPEDLAATLRRLADQLDRHPWPPASPLVVLDVNGNTCGTMALEPVL